MSRLIPRWLRALAGARRLSDETLRQLAAVKDPDQWGSRRTAKRLLFLRHFGIGKQS